MFRPRDQRNQRKRKIITSADKDKIHRLGKFNKDVARNRRVIIKFTNSKARQERKEEN